MNKRWIAYALNFILLFSLSCYTSHTLKGDNDLTRYSDRGDVRVLMAVSKRGELYYFNKSSPAWIINRTVTGVPERILGHEEIDSIVNGNSGTPEYVIAEGHRYRILHPVSSGYICHDTDSIRIAVTEISQLRILKQNDFGFGLVLIVVLGSLGLLIGGALTFIL